MAQQLDVNVNVIQKGTSSKNGNSKSSMKQRVKDSQEFAKNLEQAAKSGKSLKSSMVEAFNSSKVLGGVKFIKEALDTMINLSKATADYAESLNMMQVAFGKTSNEAEAYVSSIEQVFGFDPSILTKNLGVFRQLSSTMGYTSETADMLSTNLSKMSIDIASLYNTSIAQASKSLQSAMTGYVQSIRSLTGADITQASLQQTAYAYGVEKSVSAMTKAEKTILIYLSLEKQLSNANGDAARTINSVANQTKIFKDQLAIAGRQLGSIFIPILKSVLPIANAILMVFNEITKIILSLFGIDTSKIASEFGIASSELEIIEDGLGGISSASREAKKQLRGFDKLNNITTPTTTGTSGGGIDKRLLEALKEYNLQLDEMSNKATQIRDRIMEWLGFSKDVNGQWKWSGGTLLKNIWEWWKKLNGVAKIFVGLGVVIAVVKLYTNFKKLSSLLKSTKIWQSIELITESLGKKGLVKTIEEVIQVYPQMSKLIGTLAGATSVAIGIGEMSKGFQSLIDEGPSLNNVVDILQGLLEILGGIALIAGSFLTNGQLIAGGIAAIGIAIGSEFLQNAVSANDELENLYNNLNSEIWKDVALLEHVKTLSGELENLVGENGKVQKGNEDYVAYILGEMNSAYGTQYELIDGVIYRNGKVVSSYKDIEKEIDTYVEKAKAQLIINKYQDEYITALSKQEEKRRILNELEEDRKVRVQAVYDAKQKLIDAGFTEAEANEKIADQVSLINTEYDKQREKVEDNYSKYDELVTNFGNLEKALATNNMEDIIKYSSAIIGSNATISEEAQKEIDKVSKNAQNSIDRWISSITYDNIMKSQWEKFGKNAGLDTGREFGIEMGSIGASNFATYFQRGLNNKKFDVNTNFSMGAEKKADGGFVNEGQFFIAREAGPEMVGTIGGHTAVANNDQIVEGISVGVAKAMLAVGGNQKSNVIIEATGDTSGLLNFITFEQKKRDRQYGL